MGFVELSDAMDHWHFSGDVRSGNNYRTTMAPQMNGIAEVSSCFIYWRECVRLVKMFPHSTERQQAAAKAQMLLVIQQAYYWVGRR